MAALTEAKDSLAKASTPEPFSTSKTSNWVARVGGLPPYIQHIAHDLVEKRGKSESNAIQMAIGIVKNWCSGQGKVDKNTRAAACKAVAQWEKKKAQNKAKSAAKTVKESREREAFGELLEALAAEVDNARYRLGLSEGLQMTLADADAGQRVHDRACQSASLLLGESPRDRRHAIELLREADLWDRIALIDGAPKPHVASVGELAEAKKGDGDGSDDESGSDDEYDKHFKKLKKRGMSEKAAAAMARRMCKNKDAKEADSSGDSRSSGTYSLPDGSFPIRNVNELRKAVRAFGRAKDKSKARAHIIRRARDLKATSLLPSSWGASNLSEGAPGGSADPAPPTGAHSALDLSEFLGRYDESKHPRLHGKFARKIGGLGSGQSVHLGHGVHVQAPHTPGQPFTVKLSHANPSKADEVALAKDAEHAATIAAHARRHKTLKGAGSTLHEAFEYVDFKASLHPRDRLGKFRDTPGLPDLRAMRGPTHGHAGSGSISSVSRPPHIDSPALGAQLIPHSPGRPTLRNSSEVHQAFAAGRAGEAGSVSSRDLGNGHHALYSYATPVALRRPDGTVVYDPRKYSVTTTKQVGQNRGAVPGGLQSTASSHEEFRALVKGLGADTSGARSPGRPVTDSEVARRDRAVTGGNEWNPDVFDRGTDGADVEPDPIEEMTRELRQAERDVAKAGPLGKRDALEQVALIRRAIARERQKRAQSPGRPSAADHPRERHPSLYTKDEGIKRDREKIAREVARHAQSPGRPDEDPNDIYHPPTALDKARVRLNNAMAGNNLREQEAAKHAFISASNAEDNRDRVLGFAAENYGLVELTLHDGSTTHGNVVKDGDVIEMEGGDGQEIKVPREEVAAVEWVDDTTDLPNDLEVPASPGRPRQGNPRSPYAPPANPANAPARTSARDVEARMERKATYTAARTNGEHSRTSRR